MPGSSVHSLPGFFIYMAQQSNIQWTDHTWNIARGCTKVDEDCTNCYMYRESLDSTRYDPKAVVRTKTVFNLPMKIKPGPSNVWDGPQLVFTSSLTDWGHKLIDPYRHEMFDIIRARPDLIFQCLTKRPERLPEILPKDWGFGYENVWVGTSIGSHEAAEKRIPYLLQSQAAIKFLSCEPLTGQIKLTNIDAERAGHPNYCQINSLTGIHTDMGRPYHYVPKINWVIVGGESGNETGKSRYRECKIEWIEDIIIQCKDASVPVFVKQLGTHLAKKLGMKDRHGGDINEWPEHLRIREFPGEVIRG